MKRIIQYITILVLLPFALHSEWEEIAPFGRNVDGAFEFVIDGVAYVGGGGGPSGIQSNFQSFDPVAKQWTKLPDLPNGPRIFAFAFEANGKGYVGCGDEIGDFSAIRNDFWEYDPMTQKWTKKKDFPSGIRMGCYSFSLDNKGFVGAGFNGQSSQRDGYKYDPLSDSWTMTASIPESMIFPISFVIGNKAYVGMGGQGVEKQLKSMYSYDANLDIWTPIADFSGEVRQAASVFVYKEIAYVGGGMSDFEKNYKDVYTYNPNTNKWDKNDNMILPDNNTAWSVAFNIGDVGYYGLGVNFSTFTPSNKMFKFDLSISSVSDFPQTDELKLTFQPNGDFINFTINSTSYINPGILEIYSTDGRVIRSLNINGNTSNIHLNINKNELPPLSIIRLTQGEKAYTYKYMQE